MNASCATSSASAGPSIRDTTLRIDCACLETSVPKASRSPRCAARTRASSSEPPACTKREPVIGRAVGHTELSGDLHAPSAPADDVHGGEDVTRVDEAGNDRGVFLEEDAEVDGAA